MARWQRQPVDNIPLAKANSFIRPSRSLQLKILFLQIGGKSSNYFFLRWSETWISTKARQYLATDLSKALNLSDSILGISVEIIILLLFEWPHTFPFPKEPVNIKITDQQDH